MTDVVRAGATTSPAGRNADEATVRLRRAAGQLQGVQRMHETGRPCTELLDQLAAVRAALEAVAVLLLEEQVRHSLGPDVPAQTVDEVSAVVRRFARTA